MRLARRADGGNRSLWKARARSVGILAGAVLLGLELLYLVVANVMLSSGWLGRAVSSTHEVVVLDYDSAWTVVPGLVHVRGYRLSGQDSVLQWQLHVETARAQIDLLALFKRTFHATSIKASGVAFKIRFLRPADEFAGPKALALPPISSFANPPVLPLGVPAPPPSDEEYDLWTAHLEDVDARVTEVWIEELRFTGDFHAEGGFYFKPLRHVRVDPTSVGVSDGNLTIGSQEIVRALEGRVDWQLDSFDPREGALSDISNRLTSRMKLDAQVPSLSFLSNAAVTVTDGSGQIHVDASIERGALGPGSTFGLAVRRVEVSAGAMNVTAAAELRAIVEGAGEATAIAVFANVPLARVTGSDAGGFGSPEIRNATAEFGLAPAHLTRAKFDGGRFSATASLANPVWPVGKSNETQPTIEGGPVFARVGGSVDRSWKATADVRVVARRARFRWGGLSASGEVDGAVSLASDHVLSGTVRTTRGTIGLSDITFRESDESAKWWGRFEIERAKMSRDKGLEIAVRGRCKDATPVLAIVDQATGAIPGFVRSLLEMEGLEVDAAMRANGKLIEIEKIDARAGDTRIRGAVRAGVRTDGAVLVEKGILSVGIELRPQGTSLSPFAGEGWLRDRLTELTRASEAPTTVDTTARSVGSGG